jgi:hypothetical protein
MVALAMSAGEKKTATLSPVFSSDNSNFIFFLNYAKGLMSIGHFNQKPPIGNSLHNDSAGFEPIRVAHVRISGSPSVTNTVCSK